MTEDNAPPPLNTTVAPVPAVQPKPSSVPTTTPFMPGQHKTVLDPLKVSAAALKSAARSIAVPSPTTVGDGSVKTRKPLQLPTANIRSPYAQPIDYNALLSNVKAQNSAISSRIQASKQPHQKSTVVPSTMVGGSESTMVQANVIAPQPAAKPKTSENIMTYPPPQQHHYAKQPKPAEPKVQQANQFQQSPYNSFVRSQTLPDVSGQSQQQFDQPSSQYYGQNGNDGYTSEQDEQAAKAKAKEERRRRRRARQSHQPPPVDPYQMAYYQENPQSYADYYKQWYDQQYRNYGGYSGASTPAAYDESGSEYDGNQSRPSSRMSVGAYASPHVNQQYFAQQGQYAGAGGYDQAAAWWYWWYQQTYQQQHEKPKPERPSTPKKFNNPHCRATFSPSGFLVTVNPGRNAYSGNIGPGSPASRVNFINTSDLMKPYCPEMSEYSSFPGPLVPNETYKPDVITFSQRMSQNAVNSDYVDKDSVVLLWRFVELLLRQNGTYYGTDVSQLLTDNLPAIPEHITAPASRAIEANPTAVDHMRSLLLHGRKKDAIDFAANNNLWAHALFLAHSLSERDFLTIRNRFLAASAAPGDPLATFYQLSTHSSMVINRQAVTSDMHSWRQHLAVILSNQAANLNFQRQLYLSLGDTLRFQGRLYAAQLCYLIAGDQFSKFPPSSANSARLVLLGTEPTTSFEQLAKPYFCQLTEIYEYCLRLANSSQCLPSLQLFKAYYCMCLADYGLVHEAFRYLVSLTESLKICFNIYPDMSKQFPRVAFKWLSDLYTALHKAEPAVEFNTIEWIHKAANGGPIEPPYLNEQLQNNAQNPQSQMIPDFRRNTGDFRQSNSTPGPYHQPTAQQGHMQPSQILQASSSQSNQPPHPQQHSNHVQDNRRTPNDHIHHNNEEEPRPFQKSVNFGQSMGHRSDGAGSGVGFGSSVESVTSMMNMMNAMKKDALNFNQDSSQLPSLPPQQNKPNVAPPPPVSNFDNSMAKPHNDFSTNSAPKARSPSSSEDRQPYVSPVPTWQPPPSQTQTQVQHHEQHEQQYNNNNSAPPSQQTRDAPTPPPSSSNDQSKSPKKDTPGIFGTLMGKLPFGGNSGSKLGPKRMVLPDDSKPTLVFDKKLNRWVDSTKSVEELEEETAPPPPPPVMMPTMGNGPTPPIATSVMQQRGRSRYVDVLNPGSKPAGNGPSALKPAFQPPTSTATFFVPPPVPDQS